MGGEEVSIEDYPYQVSLQISRRHICGGSILNENYILTAGHCVRIMLYPTSVVRAGLNCSSHEGSVHKIVWVKEHEKYAFAGSGAPLNDIAIAKVDPPFKFGAAISPIPLYNSEVEIEEGQMSVTTGYGLTSEGGELSDSLMAVQVPIVNRKRCSEIYQHLGFNEIGEGYICVGTDEGGKSACKGDSGGPVVVKGQLAGIVSYGFGCNTPKVPGVYTNVAHYTKWIADKMS